MIEPGDLEVQLVCADITAGVRERLQENMSLEFAYEYELMARIRSGQSFCSKFTEPVILKLKEAKAQLSKQMQVPFARASVETNINQVCLSIEVFSCQWVRQRRLLGVGIGKAAAASEPCLIGTASLSLQQIQRLLQQKCAETFDLLCEEEAPVLKERDAEDNRPPCPLRRVGSISVELCFRPAKLHNFSDLVKNYMHQLDTGQQRDGSYTVRVVVGQTVLFETATDMYTRYLNQEAEEFTGPGIFVDCGIDDIKKSSVSVEEAEEIYWFDNFDFRMSADTLLSWAGQEVSPANFGFSLKCGTNTVLGETKIHLQKLLRMGMSGAWFELFPAVEHPLGTTWADVIAEGPYATGEVLLFAFVLCPPEVFAKTPPKHLSQHGSEAMQHALKATTEEHSLPRRWIMKVHVIDALGIPNEYGSPMVVIKVTNDDQNIRAEEQDHNPTKLIDATSCGTRNLMSEAGAVHWDNHLELQWNEKVANPKNLKSLIKIQLCTTATQKESSSEIAHWDSAPNDFAQDLMKTSSLVESILVYDGHQFGDSGKQIQLRILAFLVLKEDCEDPTIQTKLEEFKKQKAFRENEMFEKAPNFSMVPIMRRKIAKARWMEGDKRTPFTIFYFYANSGEVLTRDELMAIADKYLKGFPLGNKDTFADGESTTYSVEDKRRARTEVERFLHEKDQDVEGNGKFSYEDFVNWWQDIPYLLLKPKYSLDPEALPSLEKEFIRNGFLVEEITAELTKIVILRVYSLTESFAMQREDKFWLISTAIQQMHVKALREILTVWTGYFESYARAEDPDFPSDDAKAIINALNNSSTVLLKISAKLVEDLRRASDFSLYCQMRAAERGDQELLTGYSSYNTVNANLEEGKKVHKDVKFGIKQAKALAKRLQTVRKDHTSPQDNSQSSIEENIKLIKKLLKPRKSDANMMSEKIKATSPKLKVKDHEESSQLSMSQSQDVGSRIQICKESAEVRQKAVTRYSLIRKAYTAAGLNFPEGFSKIWKEYTAQSGPFPMSLGANITPLDKFLLCIAQTSAVIDRKHLVASMELITLGGVATNNEEQIVLKVLENLISKKSAEKKIIDLVFAEIACMVGDDSRRSDLSKDLPSLITSIVEKLADTKLNTAQVKASLEDALAKDRPEIDLLTAEDLLLLAYVFAGFTNDSELEVKDLVQVIINMQKGKELADSIRKELRQQAQTKIKDLHLMDEFRKAVIKRSRGYKMDESIPNLLSRIVTSVAAPKFKSALEDVDEKNSTKELETKFKGIPRELRPVFLAFKSGDHEQVKAVLDADFTLERANFKGGKNLLHFAAKFSCIELVKIVLERGFCHPHAEDFTGKLPQHYCRSRRCLALFDKAWRKNEDSVTQLPLRSRVDSTGKRCPVSHGKKRALMFNLPVDFLVEIALPNKDGKPTWVQATAYEYDFQTKQVRVRKRGQTEGVLFNLLDLHKIRLVECNNEQFLPLFSNLVDFMKAEELRLYQLQKQKDTLDRAEVSIILEDICDGVEIRIQEWIEELALQKEANRRRHLRMAVENTTRAFLSFVETTVVQRTASQRVAAAIPSVLGTLIQEAVIELVHDAMYESQDGFKQMRLRVISQVATGYVAGIQQRALFFISSLRPEFERWDMDEDEFLNGKEIKACLRTLGLTKRTELKHPMVKRVLSKLQENRKYFIGSYLLSIPLEVIELLEVNILKRKTLTASTILRINQNSIVASIDF